MMKKSILGALICLSGLAAQAQDAPLSPADKAVLGSINPGQYAALIYAVNACGFEPTATRAAALLRSPALPGITEAMTRNEFPQLDAKACVALARN